jgi:hypothetical protein
LEIGRVPRVRAQRAGAQLDIAAVFAMRKSESALPILFSELSARAVPTSGLRVPCVFTDDRPAQAGQQVCGYDCFIGSADRALLRGMPTMKRQQIKKEAFAVILLNQNCDDLAELSSDTTMTVGRPTGGATPFVA